MRTLASLYEFVLVFQAGESINVFARALSENFTSLPHHGEG